MERKILISIFKVYIKFCWRGLISKWFGWDIFVGGSIVVVVG